jgi:hypothetical protein
MSKLAVATVFALATGTAVADPPRVVIEPPPIFVPGERDNDRRGWHYGRNHWEGLRFEREREHRRHWWREHERDRD